MNTDDIQKEMLRLSDEFKKHKYLLHGMTIGEIKKNKELMRLFSSLYNLMQFPQFFELLLGDGFKKTTKNGINKWDFISPIMLLIGVFYKILGGLFLDREVYYFGHDFSCQEKLWTGTSASVDFHLSQWLVKQSTDELFLGVHDVYLHDKQNKSQYENLIKKLITHPSAKMTAILDVYDGIFTEPLFFIKDAKTVELLVATNSSGQASHIHSFTKQLIDEYKIKCTHSPNINVTHDGNCSIHAELNINSVLYEALRRNNSVYDVIDTLRKKGHSLSNHRVYLSDVAPNNNCPDKPDFSTLARLLTSAARVFLILGGSGWIEFCKTRAIHPKNIVKTAYNEWATIGYSNWLSTKVFFQEEPLIVSPTTKSDVAAPIVKNYIEKLADCGAVGVKILEQIERLQAHQDSCNPYWINSKEKANAIITALDNLNFTEDGILKEAVNNPNSELYNALNMQRLSPLTCLGMWGWNQAKSLQHVQEVVQTAPLTL